MLGVTFFGLFLTPVFYVTIQKLVERRRKVADPIIATAAPGRCACVSRFSSCPSCWRSPAPSVRPMSGRRSWRRRRRRSPFGRPIACRRSSIPSCAFATACSVLPEKPSLAMRSGTGEDVAWLNLLQDTVLVQLVRHAVVQNRDVMLATARVREARALAGAAKGPLFPQLYANGVGQHQPGGLRLARHPDLRRTPRHRRHAVGNRLLGWHSPLRSGGELRCRGPEEGERAVVLTVVSDVAAAYVDLRALDDQLAISERTLESRRETLRIARRRFSQGLISELDVRQFEAEVAGPAAAVAAYTRAVSQKENQLRVLLGEGPGVIPRGLPLVETVRGLEVPDSLPSSLVSQRPDVMKADRELARGHRAHWRGHRQSASPVPRHRLLRHAGHRYRRPLPHAPPRSTCCRAASPSRSSPVAGSSTSSAQHRLAPSSHARRMSRRYSLRCVRWVMRWWACARPATRRPRSIFRWPRSRGRERWPTCATRRDCRAISTCSTPSAQLFNAELQQAQTRQLQLVSVVQLYKALGGSWTDQSELGRCCRSHEHAEVGGLAHASRRRPSPCTGAEPQCRRAHRPPGCTPSRAPAQRRAG